MQVVFHARGMFLKNITQNQTQNFRLQQRISWGLGDSFIHSFSCIVYNYTTSGHTDLYTIYLVYTQFIYISIQYDTLIYNICTYF
jgi:hypothetical protein